MKRVVLTKKEYDELVTSRNWCRDNGFNGMRQWYDEQLAFHAQRYALPAGATEYREDDDDRHIRSRRDW